MTSGYEQVESALGMLQAQVNHAINRDAQDIAILKAALSWNPLLKPIYLSVSAAQWGIASLTRTKLVAAQNACRGEIQASQRVVLAKETEAEDWRTRSTRLGTHSATAAKLGARSESWLGDAGDLYRDTAKVCSAGLRELRDQYLNSADFCQGVADYHRATYLQLAMRILSSSIFIAQVGYVPFGQFFQRNFRAQAALEQVVQAGQQAASGDLARDGLSNMGSAARQALHDTEVLQWDFRADPSLAGNSGPKP